MFQPARRVVLAATLVFTAFVARAAEPAPPPDLLAAIRASADHKTLADLLKTAGLESTLQGAGPYTVFAPTDAAFARVPEDQLDALRANPDKLKKLLLGHVVPGRVLARDVGATPTELTTAAGTRITARREGAAVKIDAATVTAADRPAANGVLHVIDAALGGPPWG